MATDGLFCLTRAVGNGKVVQQLTEAITKSHVGSSLCISRIPSHLNATGEANAGLWCSGACSEDDWREVGASMRESSSGRAPCRAKHNLRRLQTSDLFSLLVAHLCYRCDGCACQHDQMRQQKSNASTVVIVVDDMYVCLTIHNILSQSKGR